MISKYTFVTGLVTFLALSAANAGMFRKEASDFNQKRVPVLDQLLPSTPTSTLGEGEQFRSDFAGITKAGHSCKVSVTRRSGYMDVNYNWYTIEILTQSPDPREENCFAGIKMDADIDVNAVDMVAYKSSDVYPRFFASRYEKGKVEHGESQINFTCQKYSKERPGYQVGIDKLNDCRVDLNK